MKLGKFVSYLLLIIFTTLVVTTIAAVLINSFGTRWHGTWLPEAFSLEYYKMAAQDHDLYSLIWFSLKVTIVTTLLAVVVSFPAAYVLSRNPSGLKTALLGVFSLPMLFPAMTYGIPLATLFYNWGLSNTFWGIVLINLTPVLPFVTLILIPFFEKIDPKLEGAAQLLGASFAQTFTKLILPLALPGVLTASLLVAVKVIANFELTFLVSGAQTQTLIVAVYNDAYGAGSRATQQIDAMAMIYTAATSVILLAALMFVSPKQFAGGR